MKIRPLQIDNITIDTPVILAPMAGYTTPPFRDICRRLGSGLSFTEMVPAEGIRRRLPQTMVYLDSYPEEKPLGAHIYGSDPDVFAAAAEIVDSLGRFDLIDINCGCPVRKIAGKGAGVALMSEPEKIRSIVTKVKEATSLPVTVKTRIGITPNQCNISEVAQAIEEGGASALFLHARFATQRHSGPVDFEMMKQIKSERSIPVIGNGGITGALQVDEMIKQTGVDGVMIGKGSIGNPWVFQEINYAWRSLPYLPPSAEERIEIMAEHLMGLYSIMSIKNELRKHPNKRIERLACEAFRGHLGKYLYGVKGIKKLQGNLMQMNSVESVIAAASQLMHVQT